MKRPTLGLFAFPLLAVVLSSQTALPKPAVPLDPIAAILDAFRSHSVVAVTAGHGEERGYASLLSLVRDPRFVAVPTHIHPIVKQSAKGQVRWRNIYGTVVVPAVLSDVKAIR